MSEPVSVPKSLEPTTIVEKSERSAIDDGEILDEGLDIAGYRGTHDSPFVADYLGIRDFYKTNDEVQMKVDFVTEHVIKKSGDAPLVYVAKQILDQYKEEMNLADEDSGLFKLRKFIDMIRAREKLDMLDQLKAQAVRDIENMV